MVKPMKKLKFHRTLFHVNLRADVSCFLCCARQACSTGADPGFFLGGGALVSCSTSTPINHIVFFLQNTSCNTENRRSSQGGGGGAHPCTLPLDPPLFNQWKERKYWTVPCERMSAQSDFSGSRKFDRHSRLRYRTRERQSCCKKKGYSR